MINEDELKSFFTKNRSEIPDNGFSKRVQQYLPPRKSVLPQIVMLICIATGLSLTLSITGVSAILVQLLSLVDSVALMQIPSLSSVMTYLGILATLSFIGFAAIETT